MRKLTETEIEKMAKYLDFTVQEAKEIAEIFYTEKLQGNYRLNFAKLENVTDYIVEYEYNWFRYLTWNELVKSEEEQNDGLTETECIALLGSAIFKLSTGMYIQTVM